MIEILACPIDKQFPLELFEIKSQKDVVIEGVLYCPKCSRYYPILDEIPIMLPDELRDKKQDLQFLEQNKKEIPKKITDEALPWHL